MVIEFKNVLIIGELESTCADILKSNGIQVMRKTTLTKEELLAEIHKYDGLIIRPATSVTTDVINAGKNLKIIGCAGIGVNNIDVYVATRNGIIVMNTPGGSTMSVAEHTCTLIMALSRNLGAASMSMKEGKWDRNKFLGSELFGKTLAIIGLGRIGKEVALRMQAFGMTTVGFDPHVTPEESASFSIQWFSLEEIWPKADYITVHTPLTPHTKSLINSAVFAKCKKGVQVINCSCGGIINENALLEALDSGQCGGAGLDVFMEEPPKDYTLLKHPNVIATPYLGANTVEAQSRVTEKIAQQFVDLLQKKRLSGVINAPALIHALNPKSEPWVQLGERLGVVGSLLTKDLSLKNVDVMMYGKSLKNGGSYMIASVMVGYLTATSVDNGDFLPRNLNLINSLLFAKQCGIMTSSTFKNGPEKDCETVKVEFQGAGGEIFELQGTAAGSCSLLLSVQGNNFTVPANLSGNVVIYRVYKTVTLTDILAAAANDGIKVAALSASEWKNSQGFGVINLDSPVSTELSNIFQIVDSAYTCFL